MGAHDHCMATVAEMLWGIDRPAKLAAADHRTITPSTASLRTASTRWALDLRPQHLVQPGNAIADDDVDRGTAQPGANRGPGYIALPVDRPSRATDFVADAGALWWDRLSR